MSVLIKYERVQINYKRAHKNERTGRLTTRGDFMRIGVASL